MLQKKFIDGKPKQSKHYGTKNQKQNLPWFHETDGRRGICDVQSHHSALYTGVASNIASSL
jgi:hypothetical protein